MIFSHRPSHHLHTNPSPPKIKNTSTLNFILPPQTSFYPPKLHFTPPVPMSLLG
jgi:hypothetical protein